MQWTPRARGLDSSFLLLLFYITRRNHWTHSKFDFCLAVPKGDHTGAWTRNHCGDIDGTIETLNGTIGTIEFVERKETFFCGFKEFNDSNGSVQCFNGSASGSTVVPVIPFPGHRGSALGAAEK